MIPNRLRHAYNRWADDYGAYAKMRGFTTTINDWPYVRRSFLTCWVEPGYHRFWQVWNPGISYFTWRLFKMLGGNHNWTFATLATFFLNGILHTIVVTPFTGWGWSFICAFSICGGLTVLSRRIQPWLHQKSWPGALNLAVNLGLTILAFDLGFKLDSLFRRLLH